MQCRRRRRCRVQVGGSHEVFAFGGFGALAALCALLGHSRCSTQVVRSAPPRADESCCRRQALVAHAATLAAGTLALPAPSGAEVTPRPLTSLQLRFNGTDLVKLPSGYVPAYGPDDLYYPPWMEGRWRVVQTLEGYSAPLGIKFLASGRTDVAEKVLAEQKRQLGRPVEFELRFVKTQRNNTVEDRAFNVGARLDAFAGRRVVKSVEYSDVPDSNREGSMQAGNGPNDPLRTVVVNVKGAAQKIFITAFQTELDAGGDLWRGLASQRTLFTAPGAGYNPIAVDEEVVTAIKRDAKGVRGRLRMLGFLNPKDSLYFDAGDHAVTVADYSLQFTRVDEAGAIAA